MRAAAAIAAVVLLFSRSAAAVAPDIRIAPTTLRFGTVVSEASGADAEPIVRAKAIDELERKAHKRGTVRVIARLDVPFAPEGTLDRAAVQRQRAAIRQSQQGVSALSTKATRFESIPFVAMEVDAQQLQHLAARPDILDVQEDVVFPLTLASSNTTIGSGTAWAAGFTGAGQTIAVLDTGVDSTHPYFPNKVVSEACYSSPSSISTSLCPGGAASSTAPGSGKNCPDELFGCFHGTHVAGIAAGNDGVGPNFGVARDAKLIAIQVFSRFDASACPTPEPCLGAYTSDIIHGLERVLAVRDDFNIAAVNMSLGSNFVFDNTLACSVFNLSTKFAIDNLRSVGIATVVAAGNSGARNGVAAPGCIASAISVGATDDDDNIASFSNVANFVSLLAPGVGVTSAIPGGTGRFNGTSMATPHVAGMWALMRQANPGADVSTILATLRATGTSINDTRSGGIATNMRRINATAASSPNSRTFTIHNDGDAELHVASINKLTPAPWITWTPAAPFVLAPGGSQTFTVTVDLAAAPVGETTTRLIVDSNDTDENPYPDAVHIVVTKAALPTVSIAVDDATASEAGANTGRFTFTRSGATSAPITIAYYLNGTASNGMDYASHVGNLTIPAGVSSASITIAPIDDAIAEDDETVIGGVASSSAYIVGTANRATVTIDSDDLGVPSGVIANSLSPTSVYVTWATVPDGPVYRVYRNGSLVATMANPPLLDTSAVANAAYLYKVRAFNGVESADSNVDFASTFVFTDGALAGTTIRAVHFAEVVNAINAARVLIGAGPLGFTPTIGAPIARQHMLDLRAGLDATRAAIGLAPLSYSDPAVVAGETTIKAVHLLELRAGVQ